MEGFWNLNQKSSVAGWRHVRVGLHFGVAAMPDGDRGSLHYTLAFALRLRKNHGKTSVRVAEKWLAEQRWARFVLSISLPFYGLSVLACWPQSPSRLIHTHTVPCPCHAVSRYFPNDVLCPCRAPTMPRPSWKFARSRKNPNWQSWNSAWWSEETEPGQIPRDGRC
jgi:hypothetical protein